MLHITSGDIAGQSLKQAGLPGEVFVWHDILYDGLRLPGWPDEKTIIERVAFIEQSTAGGLGHRYILDTMRGQYTKLQRVDPSRKIVLWFDACLFDQSMLAHILTCLVHLGLPRAELICVDAFPGVEPFNGLGQLKSRELASLYEKSTFVTDPQYQFAILVDRAFATQDVSLLTRLSESVTPPLPWVPAAIRRWLEELPNPETGLGKLESLALDAIRNGCELPGQIFKAVAAADTPPQFWGDIMLWGKINALAHRKPPLVKIEGPAETLPQWESSIPLKNFRIKPL